MVDGITNLNENVFGEAYVEATLFHIYILGPSFSFAVTTFDPPEKVSKSVELEPTMSEPVLEFIGP